jgi:uncharacterized protein YpbB
MYSKTKQVTVEIAFVNKMSIYQRMSEAEAYELLVKWREPENHLFNFLVKDTDFSNLYVKSSSITWLAFPDHAFKED